MLKKSLIVAIVAVIALALLSTQVKAAEQTRAQRINQCEASAVWKSIGAGAAYGGGVMLVASGITIAIVAPPMAAGTVATILVADTISGAALGAGSVIVSHLYLADRFKGQEPIQLACTTYVDSQILEETKKAAQATLDAATAAGNKALNAGKQLMGKYL